jgi:hypothetical protein
LGIRQGSRIEFALVGDHVEMRVVSSPAGVADSGFGMLKSRRTRASIWPTHCITPAAALAPAWRHSTIASSGAAQKKAGADAGGGGA